VETLIADSLLVFAGGVCNVTEAAVGSSIKVVQLEGGVLAGSYSISQSLVWMAGDITSAASIDLMDSAQLSLQFTQINTLSTALAAGSITAGNGTLRIIGRGQLQLPAAGTLTVEQGATWKVTGGGSLSIMGALSATAATVIVDGVALFGTGSVTLTNSTLSLMNTAQPPVSQLWSSSWSLVNSQLTVDHTAVRLTSAGHLSMNYLSAIVLSNAVFAVDVAATGDDSRMIISQITATSSVLAWQRAAVIASLVLNTASTMTVNAVVAFIDVVVVGNSSMEVQDPLQTNRYIYMSTLYLGNGTTSCILGAANIYISQRFEWRDGSITGPLDPRNTVLPTMWMLNTSTTLIDTSTALDATIVLSGRRMLWQGNCTINPPATELQMSNGAIWQIETGAFVTIYQPFDFHVKTGECDRVTAAKCCDRASSCLLFLVLCRCLLADIFAIYFAIRHVFVDQSRCAHTGELPYGHARYRSVKRGHHHPGSCVAVPHRHRGVSLHQLGSTGRARG